jgi:hypothetical protein
MRHFLWGLLLLIPISAQAADPLRLHSSTITARSRRTTHTMRFSGARARDAADWLVTAARDQLGLRASQKVDRSGVATVRVKGTRAQLADFAHRAKVNLFPTAPR